MFDIHSHILPGIDDGAADLAVSLEMARLAVANGVTVQACTPHILPGVYENSGAQIRQHVATLQKHLDDHGILLRLVCGADVHMAPDIEAGLKSGRILTIAESRYVLVEPPHHVAPVRLVERFFNLMIAGYHPILTHPERLGWIKGHYDLIEQLVDGGVWMQITAGSLLGRFGATPQYWAERMLSEGRVHVIASDTHDTRRRPPNLLEGATKAAECVGIDEAVHMVKTRPMCILSNEAPSRAPARFVGNISASHSTGAVKSKVAYDNLASQPRARERKSTNGAPPEGASDIVRPDRTVGAGLRDFLIGVRRYVRR